MSKTYHREKHEWGFRDFYFHLGRQIEYVKRVDKFCVQNKGDLLWFNTMTEARKWVKSNPDAPLNA